MKKHRPIPTERPWTVADIKRLTTNPFYCGFRVDPVYTLDRPIDGDGYIQAATQIIREIGAKNFLQNLLVRLQDPLHPLPEGTSITDDHLLSAVKVHPHFTLEHGAVITTELFVGAGVNGIEQEGPQSYLQNFLENLRGNWV